MSRSTGAVKAHIKGDSTEKRVQTLSRRLIPKRSPESRWSWLYLVCISCTAQALSPPTESRAGVGQLLVSFSSQPKGTLMLQHFFKTSHLFLRLVWVLSVSFLSLQLIHLHNIITKTCFTFTHSLPIRSSFIFFSTWPSFFLWIPCLPPFFFFSLPLSLSGQSVLGVLRCSIKNLLQLPLKC